MQKPEMTKQDFFKRRRLICLNCLKDDIFILKKSISLSEILRIKVKKKVRDLEGT